MGVDLFQQLFAIIDMALETYIYDTGYHMVQFVNPIFNNMMILWIVIWGYLCMTGQTNEPLKEGLFRIMRIGFILTLGLTLGIYMDVVVNFFSKGPEEIAGVITGSPSGSIAISLDQLLTKVFWIVGYCWDQAGVFDGNFGLYFLGFGFMLAGMVFLLPLAFFLMSAKIMTAVLLGLGPLFIVLLLFKGTQRFFESWLHQVCNYGMILIIAAGIGNIAIFLATKFMAKFGMPSGSVSGKEAYSAAAQMSSLSTLSMLGIVFVLCCLALLQVPSLASQLGGGIALGTQNIISSSMNAMRPSSIRRAGHNIQRDLRSVRTTTGRAVSKGAAAYRKHFGSKVNSIAGI